MRDAHATRTRQARARQRCRRSRTRFPITCASTSSRAVSTTTLGSGVAYDGLLNPVWRSWFLRRCGLEPTEALSASVQTSLIRLRTLLRHLLTTRRAPSARTLSELNQTLRHGVRFTQLSSAGGETRISSQWRCAAWAAAATLIIESYVRIQQSRQLGLVRVCENPRLLLHVLRRFPHQAPGLVRPRDLRQPRARPGASKRRTAGRARHQGRRGTAMNHRRTGVGSAAVRYPPLPTSAPSGRSAERLLSSRRRRDGQAQPRVGTFCDREQRVPQRVDSTCTKTAAPPGLGLHGTGQVTLYAAEGAERLRWPTA